LTWHIPTAIQLLEDTSLKNQPIFHLVNIITFILNANFTFLPNVVSKDGPKIANLYPV